MELRAGYKQTEVGVIPQDWEVKRIGELAIVGSGGTPSRKNPAYWGGSIPWVTTSQIDFGIIESADQFISELGLQNSAAKLLPKGTLLLALYGQGKTRGKVAMLGFEATTNQACASIFLTSNVSREYVLHFLGSRYEALRNASNTGSQENLNGQIVKDFPVVCPPPFEQRAIATALSNVDALLAKIDQLIVKKRDLKQAAMQKLLTGQTRLPGFSAEWEVKRLGDLLLEISDGGTPSTAKRSNFGGPISWVVIDDIRDEIWVTKETLSEQGLRACAARLWPIGTLILSTGATIGEVGIAKVPVATKQGICGLVFKPNVAVSAFMKYWFQQNKQLLLSKAQGSSIKEVRAPTLVQFSISTPNKAEQTAIATALSDMDAELAALEARRDKTRALKQGMMQALLTGRIRLVGGN